MCSQSRTLTTHPPNHPYHPLITTLTKTQRICTDLEIVFFGPPGGTHTQPTPYRLFLGLVRWLGLTRASLRVGAGIVRRSGTHVPVLEPVIAPLEQQWGVDPGFGRRCRGQGLPLVRLFTPHCLHSDPRQCCYLAVHAECGASYRRRGADSGVYGRLWRRSFTAAVLLRSPCAPWSPLCR